MYVHIAKFRHNNLLKLNVLISVIMPKVKFKFKLPQALVDFFTTKALKNHDNFGQVETLAIATGRRAKNTIFVTELIFPLQHGSSDKVEDEGKNYYFNILF